MLRALTIFVASVLLAAPLPPDPGSILHADRASAGDLEVGGELAGVPAGATRYIRYEELLRLPQETYTVSDDTNFKGKTEISGVALTTLARLLGQAPGDAQIVAICYDHYRTNYPKAYLAAHRPLLVLRVNGQLRDYWPPSEHGGSLGPFLISHPFFKPAFKILSHEDEPQIPYGVTRIEVRRESVVFGAIKPAEEWRDNRQVQQGFIIARQDCFRCHNMGAEGGTMGGHSWLELARMADLNALRFRKIIHDPASVKPDAQMPAHGDYDKATLEALTAYFRTFHQAASRQPERKP